MNSFIECLFVVIELPQKKLKVLLGCVYKPPNSDINLFNCKIVDLLKLIDIERNSLVLIADDYNLDPLKQDVHEPTAEFINNMLSYSFIPTIMRPTRITDTSAIVINNMFLNKVQYTLSSAIVYSNISDHLPIAVHIDIGCSMPEVRPRAVHRRVYQQESINIELCNPENWFDVYRYAEIESNGNKAYDNFYITYRTLFDKHFLVEPIKKVIN